MNTVKIRDIEIGAGAPKIIVPIVGVTKEDIIEEAKTFDSIPVDVVEWRVDWQAYRQCPHQQYPPARHGTCCRI